MRTPLVVVPDSLTPEQFAKKIGIPRKRFLELKAITDRVFADVVGKRADDAGLTIPEYLKSLRTPPDSTSPAPEAAASNGKKTHRRSKASSSARKSPTFKSS
jgi:hypothetical protein